MQGFGTGAYGIKDCVGMSHWVAHYVE